MKALILAGGRGSRLMPFTTTVPKPLVPVGDRPILELLLEQLRAHGITDVVLAVGYLAHLIEGAFANGERLGLSLRYLREEEPLGTAGPIAGALADLGETFLVMNGDLLTTLDFRQLLACHYEAGADVTVAVCKRTSRGEFGVIEHDAAGRLTDYREKPVQSWTVSMGCYVFRRAAVAPHVRPGEFLDMPDLILRLRDAGKHIHCALQQCSWFDIGRPEDHQSANEWLRRSENRPASAG